MGGVADHGAQVCDLPSSSGSLAMLAAMRRASSLAVAGLDPPTLRHGRAGARGPGEARRTSARAGRIPAS